MSIDIKSLKQLTKTLSVLYVEDNPNIQEKMAIYLRKFFKSVKLALNGVEGLELYEQDKIDIVITDLSMPKLNGIEMIKLIKEIDATQAILVTTAHDESAYLLEVVKAHVDGFILKPFEYDVLNFELYKIAERLNKYRENEEYKLHLKEMLKHQTQEMRENYEKSIYSMIELIEQRDTYTAGHSKRVAYYCELIAKEMGYSDEKVTLLHQAGILHDVGKIETPDAVLLNPKQLNDMEYKLIQEHVNVGFKLLNSIPMFKALAPMIKSHHERYDGSGYPEGLKANEINEFSRIMIVADAFDAMTTNRIYKGRKSIDEALQELKSLSKKQFHPEIVEVAFVALKGVSIDSNINQLPKTKLEEERFAYFYNDVLTSAYNQNYLDVVLMKNEHEHVFNYMLLFSINNFTQFNKKEGWKKGDEVLKEFANILITHLQDTIIFRIFGDDFVVLSKNSLSLNGVKKVIDKFIYDLTLSYKIEQIDLNEVTINSLNDIEHLL